MTVSCNVHTKETRAQTLFYQLGIPHLAVVLRTSKNEAVPKDMLSECWMAKVSSLNQLYGRCFFSQKRPGILVHEHWLWAMAETQLAINYTHHRGHFKWRDPLQISPTYFNFSV